jgi:uncharacterized protein (TIRG00374 family)
VKGDKPRVARNVSISSLVKFVFSLLLAAALFHLATARLEGTLVQRLVAAEPDWLLIGFLLYGLGIALACWRWGRLLEVLEVQVPMLLLLRLGLIGIAFSFALPGAVSGDVVKAGYVAAYAADRQVEAALSVIVDRLLGLLGLFLVTLLVLTSTPLDAFVASPILQAGIGLVLLMAAFGTGTLLAIFLHRSLMWMRLGRAVARRIPERVRLPLRRIAAASDLFRAHPRVLVVALAASMGVHSLVGLSVFALSRAVGVTSLALRPCFVATQVANTLAAIPLTPGGVGGRDLVLSRFLEATSLPPSAASLIPALLTLVLLAWSAIGGLVFFLQAVPTATPSERSASEVAEPALTDV